MIPLLDLQQLNKEFQSEIEAAVLRVARSGRYVLGPEVEAFEEEWALTCDYAHCVGTGNALDALRLMLMASGIGPGHEVLVPANTYIATWMAITLAGATPVPVDADERTMNMDPNLIAAAVTPRTRALLFVYLYGNTSGFAEAESVARKMGLKMFVDAAQAHGAKCEGAERSDAEVYSFYPSKNLGAMGDGGAVVTDDAALAEKIRRLRNYGGVGRLDHQVIGINSRLDEMQAAVLRAKLPFLKRMNRERSERAEYYRKTLVGVTHPAEPSAAGRHVWHQYVVRVSRREAVIAEAAARGLELHVHYPVPPHLEPAYSYGGYDGLRGEGWAKDGMQKTLAIHAFPVAEKLAEEVMSLPIGSIPIWNVSEVCHRLHEALAATREKEAA